MPANGPRGERLDSALATPDGMVFRDAVRGRRRVFPTSGAVVSGCSSGVEHNLAKVGVEGSNPFARSN
jgi:hypothetical protein